MTFELSSEQQALQARAHAAATERVAPLADAIDANAAIPTILGLDDLLVADQSIVDSIVVIEELATASAAVAAAAGLRQAGLTARAAADADLPGLRGLGAIDADLESASEGVGVRAQLVLAAVAVGIGRAAVDQALAAIRASGDRPSGDPDDRPHWALADAATEVEGARLLTVKAAQSVARGDGHDGRADARLAKLFAADVAARAVDAALRILGPAGYRRGTVTERLTRDARTIGLLGGTPEAERAAIATATLPA